VRLLLVNYEYPPIGGGASNATQALGRAFVGLGHEVRVLTSALGRDGGVREEDGMIVERLPVGRAQADRATPWQMVRFILGSRAAVTRLRRAPPDAALAFFTIPSGPAALQLHRACGTPYAVSLRGGDVPGHVPGLDRMHQLTAPLRRAVLRSAAAVVANSEGLAATSRAADPFPVRIIPNGVDCAKFRPAAAPAPAGGPIRLLFVGRIHPEKNLGLVITALADLAPGTRERFTLAVAGDGAQRAELEALAVRRGVAGQITWLGWQRKEAIPALYHQADVLVNPSQYEGMPNAVLEAMASGLAVVASDVPGNRSVVEGGRTGEFFPLEQPGELTAIFARLAADPGRRAALGRAGRERAEACFSWIQAAKSYLELLAVPRAPSGSP
jgi:glycosyltransferase involved in cell wall biosynthesis